jgi:hypothetical protein
LGRSTVSDAKHTRERKGIRWENTGQVMI